MGTWHDAGDEAGLADRGEPSGEGGTYRVASSEADRSFERIQTDGRWRIIGWRSSTAGPQHRDGRAFAEAIARLMVLHDLKTTGALTYDEFTVLKARLLGL